MVYLTISLTTQSEKEVERLETILSTWDLKIVQYKVDNRKSVLQLSINASMPSIMSLMISIARSRFQEDLLESNMQYEVESEKFAPLMKQASASCSL